MSPLLARKENSSQMPLYCLQFHSFLSQCHHYCYFLITIHLYYRNINLFPFWGLEPKILILPILKTSQGFPLGPSHIQMFPIAE